MHDSMDDPQTLVLQRTSSTYPHLTENQATAACNRLTAVIHDPSMYRLFLAKRGKDAQALVNHVQALLDLQLDVATRNAFIDALLRLSWASGLYPETLVLDSVQRCGYGPVASGKFGDIWQGHFRGELVAIKTLKFYVATDAKKFLKDFTREAFIWKQLCHPNVLPFYGIRFCNGDRLEVSLISPWMSWGNAPEFLRKYPGADRLSLVRDVAQGLDYLHRNKITHGDLKGVNVLINSLFQACLSDFGMATYADSHVPKVSSSSTAPKGGTLRWEAPELLDDTQENNSTGRMATDIYAFACVCYEIFTDNVPFREISNDAAIVLKVIRGNRPTRPPPDVCANRKLDDMMWRLMEHCWRAQPTGRPTAREVAVQLSPNHTLDHDSVS